MTPLSITQHQVNYINWLLTQLHVYDIEQYLSLTCYPIVKNTFTYFIRQQQRGFVTDLTIGDGAYMIDTLKCILNM